MEYKQLPKGYAEVLENTQLTLVATCRKLYDMVKNGTAWTLEDPMQNDRGEVVIHDIADKLGCIRPNSDVDLPVSSFPENEDGLKDLLKTLRAKESEVEQRKQSDASKSAQHPHPQNPFHQDQSPHLFHHQQQHLMQNQQGLHHSQPLQTRQQLPNTHQQHPGRLQQRHSNSTEGQPDAISPGGRSSTHSHRSSKDLTTDTPEHEEIEREYWQYGTASWDEPNGFSSSANMPNVTAPSHSRSGLVPFSPPLNTGLFTAAQSPPMPDFFWSTPRQQTSDPNMALRPPGSGLAEMDMDQGLFESFNVLPTSESEMMMNMGDAMLCPPPNLDDDDMPLDR
ncbi:hypothetical protein CDD82_7199 [Ophiocordyceps australis]|uniref:Uncharacterized protein n=1 Tax=Ophiocordyceps australis TaxID=1399860 RepID=A0A2C5ZRU2_9HYPO|nr:hypothetical protein CDD82_7199 [Ophiocordyceps australis]